MQDYVREPIPNPPLTTLLKRQVAIDLERARARVDIVELRVNGQHAEADKLFPVQMAWEYAAQAIAFQLRTLYPVKEFILPTPEQCEGERFYAENADYERAREAWESEQLERRAGA
jgi:hypothetical protein